MPVVYRGAAVAHGVFHNGLEDQRGQIQDGQYIGQVPGDMDGILESSLGEGQIVADIRQLLLQEDKGLVDGKSLPEVACQGEDGFPGL